MSRPRTGPPSRAAVLLAGAALLGALSMVVVLAEALRPPPAAPPPDLAAEPPSDPRIEVECPQPQPREGQERRGDTAVGTVVEVTANELYDCPETFDGQRVRYRGEVVGAVLQRDDGAWLQLNDDAYARGLGQLPAHREFRGGNAGVGVFVPPAVAERITIVGGPDAAGDVLTVEGVFHRVDADTVEVAIIRADEGEITTRGTPVSYPTLPARRNVAWALALLCAVVVVGERIAARRR